ncbi:hypothetical protein [Seonamhaeicola sp. ML3]|uniref:hypothetical protein n=1 Tax=Seonamhaeicola sp. ML3 TaxID=2937786 RepID=UPI00200DC2D1|nr:hypothetical protein [Seonamhaeicola sp. ML3]
MKSIFSLVFVLSVLSLNAQPPEGGFQRGGQGERPEQGNNPQGQRPNRFDPYKMAGIVYHDLTEVIEKLKIKKDKTLKAKVEEAIINHNKRLKEISLANKANFDTLGVYMRNTSRKLLLEGGSREQVQEVRASVREKIKPVRDTVMEEERKLNTTITALLDEKQTKRWRNYIKEFKAKLRPQRPGGGAGNRNGQGNFQRGGNQQRSGSQGGGQGFGGGGPR